jgi:hypothetical protein
VIEGVRIDKRLIEYVSPTFESVDQAWYDPYGRAALFREA